MKSCYLFLGFLVTMLLLSCGDRPLSKESSNPYLFTKENSPYHIQDTFIIPANAKFKIEPGVELLLDSTAQIISSGTVEIIGTAAEPIHFRPKYPEKGWGTFFVEKTASQFVLQHAVIDNGKLTSWSPITRFSNVRFTNTRNLHWFTPYANFFNSNVIVDSCTLIGNNSGEGLLVHWPKGAQVTNCLFRGVPDAIEFLHDRGGIIANNTFLNGGDDAIDLNHCTNTIVENNFIKTRKDSGIEIGNDGHGVSKNVIVKRNVFIGCKRGIYMKQAATARFENNTFYKNKIGFHLESIKAPEPCKAIVINSIFEDQTAYVYQDDLAQLTFEYCIAEDTLLPGKNNIIGHSMFINTENDDFHLSPNSPCINAGSPKSDSDLDGSRADIGAFPFIP